jgi:hypothetical protein
MFYKKMGMDVELYFLLYLMRFSYCSSNIFDRTILVSLKKKNLEKEILEERQLGIENLLTKL